MALDPGRARSPTADRLAAQPDLDFVDLCFLDNPEVIATAILAGDGGVALIDPGPSSTLPTLRSSLERKGIGITDVRQLLLTHIHLDHAGAAGTLMRENPRIELFVHERGAPHMVDPTKLLASATRLYGSDMDRLWGEFVAVAADRVRVLVGGERIVAGGRTLDVAYTPGHASHHVTYFDPSSGTALVGDTAGIRRRPGTYVMPPTPPPDIDLELWRGSMERILDWKPARLFLTHFGAFENPTAQFDELAERLELWSGFVRTLLADSSLDDSARERKFVDEVTRELQQIIGPQQTQGYSRAGRLDYSWQGLARYWRKRLSAV